MSRASSIGVSKAPHALRFRSTYYRAAATLRRWFASSGCQPNEPQGIGAQIKGKYHDAGLCGDPGPLPNVGSWQFSRKIWGRPSLLPRTTSLSAIRLAVGLAGDILAGGAN